MNIGFMVIRNGIRLGYPFVEAAASMHRCCDKFLFFDCGSDDGTREIMLKMREMNNKFEVYDQTWPAHSSGGNAIAVATNDALRHDVIQQASKVFYVQADEIYHHDSLPSLIDFMGSKDFKSVSFKFLHFRNSFLHYISNPTYDRAIRVITPQKVNSVCDGFNFSGDINPVRNCNVVIFHLGWCFPYNICQKHVNHAGLYPGDGGYGRASRICKEMLDSGEISRERLIREVDTRYKLTKYPKENMPRFVEHLYDLDRYDADLSLTRLGQDLL